MTRPGDPETPNDSAWVILWVLAIALAWAFGLFLWVLA